MKINAPKDKYIFIELTGEDMKRMNLTYEKLDYSNPQTRAVLHSLLEEAKSSLGYSLSLPDKIKIDALPSFDGGCLLFFTVNSKPLKYKLKSRGTQLSFEFEKQEDVFDLARSFSTKEAENIKSSLYVYDGRTVLFIKGKLKHSVVARINEYAVPLKSDNHIFARVREYGECKAENNALEIFGGRFPE